MNSINDQPSSKEFSSLAWPWLTREHKRQLLSRISHSAVSPYVNLATLKYNGAKRRNTMVRKEEG